MAVPLFAPRGAQTAGGAGDVPVAARASATRPVHGYAREAAALMLLASALFSSLALASFRGDPLRPELEGLNWVGPVGAIVARAGVETIGLAAWFFPIELVLLAGPLLKGRPSIANVTRIAGDIVVVFILAALAEVAFPKATAFGAMPLGGLIGELFGEVLRTLFSSIGSYIIGLTIVALILLGRATFSFIEWVQRVERTIVALAERIATGLRAILGAWATARELDKKRDAEARRAAAPKITRASPEDAIIAALTEDNDAPERRSMEIALAPGDGPPVPIALPLPEAAPTESRRTKKTAPKGLTPNSPLPCGRGRSRSIRADGDLH